MSAAESPHHKLSVAIKENLVVAATANAAKIDENGIGRPQRKVFHALAANQVYARLNVVRVSRGQDVPENVGTA